MNNTVQIFPARSEHHRSIALDWRAFARLQDLKFNECGAARQGETVGELNEKKGG